MLLQVLLSLAAQMAIANARPQWRDGLMKYSLSMINARFLNIRIYVSDVIQLSQPVRHRISRVLVTQMLSIGFLYVTGAYDEACIRWVDRQPCIVGKASLLESQQQLELIQIVISKDWDAPV